MINNEYYLWGAGTYGARLIEFMEKELTFKAIIDNNPKKQGKIFHGLPIISYEDVKQNIPDVKIVIALVYPNIVRDFLFDEGYVEYEDFMSIYDFIPRYFWAKDSLLVPKVVNMSPTNFCNLKCEHCQSQMHLCKNPKITPPENMIKDIDLLFSHVNSIFLINLCLGESFLNKNLSIFVKHVYEQYSNRYGSLVILTNGTIVPTDEELIEFAKTNATISISDYSDGDSSKKAILQKLIDKCEQFGIRYYVNSSSNKDAWFDFGNPLVTNEIVTEKLKKRFVKCFKPGTGVKRGKIYLCQAHNIALAVAGASHLEEGDYFDLQQPKTEQSKLDLLKIITRTPDRGYVEHCKNCNGTTLISEGANN